MFKCEELSELDIEVINSWRKDSALDELSDYKTYESVKELASTPWGQDHLQIISAWHH